MSNSYEEALERAEDAADDARTPAEFEAAMAKLRKLEDGR